MGPTWVPYDDTRYMDLDFASKRVIVRADDVFGKIGFTHNNRYDTSWLQKIAIYLLAHPNCLRRLFACTVHVVTTLWWWVVISRLLDDTQYLLTKTQWKQWWHHSKTIVGDGADVISMIDHHRRRQPLIREGHAPPGLKLFHFDHWSDQKSGLSPPPWLGA